MHRLEGMANKFYCVKRDDVSRLHPFEQSGFAHYCARIEQERGIAGKSQGNRYLVINVDEPYADEVIDILKRNGHWGEANDGN